MSSLALFASTAECMRRAYRLADLAVVADVETEGVALDELGRRWYDVLPMLDPRERPPQLVDMAREALVYGLERGLLQPHPSRPATFCIARVPT